MNDDQHVMRAQRVINAPREKVLKAHTEPERLARWWGPNGFTNKFEVCDIRAGGSWVFVMIGPDGATYPNENRFVEVSADRIVIEHVSQPHFTLTVEFKEVGDKTEVRWTQRFHDADTIAKIRAFLEGKNEENLARLASEAAQIPG